MRFEILLLAVGLSLTACSRANAETFGELVAWCAPADRGGKPNLCSGYLDSELELLASTDRTVNSYPRVCAGAKADRAQVIELLRAYARANPGARDGESMDGLSAALGDHFPCG